MSALSSEATFKRQLQKLVLQATNLKRPDSDVLELLREAEELL